MIRLSRFLLLFLGCLACSDNALPSGDGGDGGGGDGGSPADARISLQPAVRFQSMRGWAATTQAGQSDLSFFSRYSNVLAEWAVDSVGITRLRLEIRSGSENPRDIYAEVKAGTIPESSWRCLRYETINDNADPMVMNPAGFHWSEIDKKVETVVLPIRQRLQARGEQLFLNVNYVAFVQQCNGTRYDHQSPAEYAEFALATVQHLRDKYGLVPDSWEMILEPDNDTPWRGPTIGAAAVATAARFKAAGFDIPLVAPSTLSMANAVPYFNGIAAVPGAAGELSDLSYHRYSGVSDENLRAIGARAAQAGVSTGMLEKIGADYHDLAKDLTLANASSWQQYTLAYEDETGNDNGAQYLIVAPSGPPIRLASRTRYLRHYFRAARLGAVRIGASTTDDAFSPIAFVNADGRQAVVVQATRAGLVAVAGLEPGRYTVARTVDDRDGKTDEITIEAGQELHASISGKGVLSVVRR